MYKVIIIVLSIIITIIITIVSISLYDCNKYDKGSKRYHRLVGIGINNHFRDMGLYIIYEYEDGDSVEQYVWGIIPFRKLTIGFDRVGKYIAFR